MPWQLRDSLIVSAARRYHRSHAGDWATVIAWNGLLAFVPIVVTIVVVLAVLLHHPRLAAQLERQLALLFTDRVQRREVLAALGGLSGHAVVVAGAGVLGLAWTATALFGAMDVGLSRLHGVSPRPFWRRRIRGLALMPGFCILLVAMVMSSSVAPWASTTETGAALPGELDRVFQFVFGAAVATALFAGIYLVVPNRRVALPTVLPGAVAAGMLLEGFTELLPAYVRVTGSLGTYGAFVGLLSLLIAYFFAFGQITVVGVCVNLELSASGRRRRQEIPGRSD